MIVPLRAYRDNLKALSWYNEGVEYTLETDGSKWIMYAEGMTVRDSYGHPLTFTKQIDAQHYARNVLGHTFN